MKKLITIGTAAVLGLSANSVFAAYDTRLYDEVVECTRVEWGEDKPRLSIVATKSCLTLEGVKITPRLSLVLDACSVSPFRTRKYLTFFKDCLKRYL